LVFEEGEKREHTPIYLDFGQKESCVLVPRSWKQEEGEHIKWKLNCFEREETIGVLLVRLRKELSSDPELEISATKEVDICQL
jgi:hypothetical protein